MKTANRYHLLIAFSLLLMAGSLVEANAQIRIYRTTYSAKSALFPRRFPVGNSQVYRGYLIIDTQNSASAQTVDIYPDKTYEFNSGLWYGIIPTDLILAPFDRNSDAFFETELALFGKSVGDSFHSRIYRGRIPRSGVRLNGQTVFGAARVIRGIGTNTVLAYDHFRVNNVLRLDPLTGENPSSVGTGVGLVVTRLAEQGYTRAN
ncbi:MAG: hypothetical protein KDN20_22380 [Verrucomicrobiae bacterium]|nr:hypothetical protein [Verrucomicrobiae bacterium]